MNGNQHAFEELARGMIYDRQGALGASTAQEGVARIRRDVQT